MVMDKRMIKTGVSAVVLTSLMAISFTGCGKTEPEVVTNKDESTAMSSEASEDISLPSVEVEEAEEVEEEEAEAVTEDEETTLIPEDDSDRDDAQAIADTFEQAVAYINRTGGVIPEIDYNTIKYKPAERDSELQVNKKAPREIEDKLKGDRVKKIRMHRSGNGATLDFDVYTDPEDRYIDKIVSTEYGSEGREITGYYYKNGVLLYTYRYLDDLYGINAEDARKSGGQRCFFVNDFLAEGYATYGDKNESVTAASYKNVNPDIQKEYDDMEAELINRAYVTYNTLKDIPSTAKVYGYVADEQGGTLANTEVTIMSEANAFKKKVITDGDGFYEFTVPVNTADWYNMTFVYGDFADSKVNDVYIRPRTVEYPIGVTYMAPEGNNVHDKDTFLLDVTKQSPDKLREDQYEVVLTYNTEKIRELTPFTLDLNSGKYENRQSQIITVANGTDYKYFVADRINGKSGNNLTNDMSLSEAQVKVYNKNGLVASFQVPVGNSGVLWEVFEVKGSEIIPSNNYYFLTGKNIFF